MKYIKTKNEIKESFKTQAVLYSGFALMQFLPNYFADPDVDYLMNAMKKQESKPSLFIENKIDSLRKYLTKEIDNSNYKYKEELKDSINSIPIFTVDLSKIRGGEASGCQILFNNKDMHKNVIFVDDNVPNEKVSTVILHELYHFISKIEKIDYFKYVDKSSITNNDVLLNKLSIILTNKKYNELSDNEKVNIKNLTNNFIKERPYLTANEEFIVRILEMKNWLISEGKITNISDELKKSDLRHIFMNRNKLNSANFMDILPFMNFNLLFPINDL